MSDLRNGSNNGHGSMTPAPTPVVGVLEWFRPGEHDRVERLLADLKRLGVTHLRTGVSWADWMTPEGEAWYGWLLPRLAREVEVLPCFVYTPPSLGIEPKSSAPPRDPKWYADFLDMVITRHGDCFEWVELWNEPNNRREWDVALDPEWLLFSAMVGGAAYWAHQRGKKTVLGGPGPCDPDWIRLMCERGVIAHIDAVGVHGFPVTFEFHWDGWDANIARVRDVLDRHGSQAEIWVTETGYSTCRHDERRQLDAFVDALNSPAERVYWYAAHDLAAHLPTVDGFHSDEREYHFGLRREDGSEKLLFRLWAEGGLDAVRQTGWLGGGVHQEGTERPTLITGGAGFIGTNLADRLLREGRPVLLYDNLSRPGVEKNARWLREQHGERVQIEVADVRDSHALGRAIRRASQVFHFAAQVAVTSSLVNPIYDFEVNARGTLNLLEAIRAQDTPPPLAFTSTNKVYGGLDDVPLRRRASRYEPEDTALRASGIGESRPLDFHSPYGCSKGTADQYVLDYARSFGLSTVVFRMSCIYGPHQFGTEDQGWVAHFLIRALQGKPITLYGDGMQVRDILFVEDLVSAFLLAMSHIGTLKGQAFNIGGGPDNTTSLLGLLGLIGEIHGHAPDVSFENWRVGDQRYYVSDTTRFQTATGWTPQVDVYRGVERLYAWLCEAGGVAPTGGVPAKPGTDGGGPMSGNSSMRAAVLAEPGRIEIVEVPVPEPGPQEVRVRLEGCGVCASNLSPWQGEPWFTYPFDPGALGHEGWGVVDAVGSDASGFQAGDRVAMLSNHAYAEYDVAPTDSVVKLPDALAGQPFPGEPLACAVNIFRRSGVGAGQTVAIVGIGFLGALLTRMAWQAGARVIAIARRPYAQAVARDMGAAEIIAMDDHWRIIEQVKQLTGGGGCDVVIEAIGKQWPLDLSTELVREMGRLVIAGYHQDGPRQVNMQQWNWKGLDVINAHEREQRVYTEGIARAMQAVAEGRLDPSPLYTHTFPLDGLDDALNMTRDRPEGFLKALVTLS